MIAAVAHRISAPAALAAAPPVRIPDAALPPLGDLLSEREEEIARLAARGLSNKQIGQRLGISPWTVATHLRRTFLKLEITRRIELCAFISTLADRSRPSATGSMTDQEGASHARRRMQAAMPGRG